ncbi:unnamed protein product [Closterium sp. NIES-65]|nr:unnamed protein product [Closterium sp. NIES-65]
MHLSTCSHAWLRNARAKGQAWQLQLDAGWLRYRSRQRGFLELDLLLGKWVEQHLPSLDPPHLTALARLMDEESPDLFKWFTGQEQAPEHVLQNPVYLSIRSKVDERLHRMHPAVKAAPGLPWVRGWEDMQRQPGTPPAGNQ